MTTATADKPRIISGVLYEDRAQGYAPLVAGKSRVDRERGIIFGAKLVGKESPNCHDRPEVTRGTYYTPLAMQEELALIPADGAKLNINHPKDRKVRVDREAEDRLGKAKDPFIFEDELYGDLHLLLSHPMAERLMEAAERMPDAFAISHNVRGDGPVEDGVWVITHIGVLKSFDVVADGGTNKSLFEGAEVKTKIKLKELCESKPALKEKLAPLFEICPLAGGMLVEAEDSGDYRDHLHMAKKMCEDAGYSEMAGKIHGLMKPKKEEGETDDEEDTAGNEEETARKEEKADKAKMESRLHELEAKDQCRTLCESLGFVPSPIQLKSLIQLSPADRTVLVKDFKSLKGPAGPISRSLIPAPKEGMVHESADAAPEKPEDQLAWLRS